MTNRATKIDWRWKTTNIVRILHRNSNQFVCKIQFSLHIFRKWVNFECIDWCAVFSLSQELTEIHSGFHMQLRKACMPCSTQRMSEVFLGWRQKFIVYGDYCANLTTAQSRIMELCSRNEALNQEINVRVPSTPQFSRKIHFYWLISSNISAMPAESEQRKIQA